MHASNTSRTFWRALIGAGAVAALGACMSTTPSGFPDENGGPGSVLFRDVCQPGRPGGGAMQCMAKIVIRPDGSGHPVSECGGGGDQGGRDPVQPVALSRAKTVPDRSMDQWVGESDVSARDSSFLGDQAGGDCLV